MNYRGRYDKVVSRLEPDRPEHGFKGSRTLFNEYQLIARGVLIEPGAVRSNEVRDSTVFVPKEESPRANSIAASLELMCLEVPWLQGVVRCCRLWFGIDSLNALESRW